MKLEEAK